MLLHPPAAHEKLLLSHSPGEPPNVRVQAVAVVGIVEVVVVLLILLLLLLLLPRLVVVCSSISSSKGILAQAILAQVLASSWVPVLSRVWVGGSAPIGPFPVLLFGGGGFGCPPAVCVCVCVCVNFSFSKGKSRGYERAPYHDEGWEMW